MTTREKPSYEHLLAQARLLAQADQLRLLEALAAQLRQHLGNGSQQHIAAPRGLSQDVWRGVDAQKYVDR